MSSHREDIVRAVTSFYETLTTFPYLSPSNISTSPPSGWNSSEARSLLQREGKSEAVLDLLNHLPYLINDQLHIHYDTVVIDWRVTAAAPSSSVSGTQQLLRNALSIPQTLQQAGLEPVLQTIPAHVIALTRATSNYGRWLLLDVADGTVTNYSLLGEPNNISVTADEEDAGTGWRRHETMPVVNFFATWEAKLRSLAWIPVPGDADLRTGEVHLPQAVHDAEHEELADIYRNYGWASPEFDREKCKEAIVQWNCRRLEAVRAAYDEAKAANYERRRATAAAVETVSPTPGDSGS